jgi:hypothetical protein
MDLTQKQSPTSERSWIKSCTLVITYKVGTTRDIPSIEVLIKGRGPIKHLILAWEKKENMFGWECLFLQKPPIRNGLDSESNSETYPNQWMYWIELYALVVTYKSCTTGDIPVINGFTEFFQRVKQVREVCDTIDTPVIHGSTAIIVDAMQCKGWASIEEFFVFSMCAPSSQEFFVPIV